MTAFCFFSMPSVIHACSCATSDPPSEFNRAKVVFTGRMLGGTEKFSSAGEKGAAIRLEAGDVRFSVEESFKGDISGKITIRIDSMRGTSCGDYGLKRGEVYLIYAYASDDDADKLLYSGVCTRTAPVNSEYIKEDLKFLRNLPAPGTGGNLQGKIWADSKKMSGDGAESLAGIKVKITSENGNIINVETDKDGAFEVKKIKAGKYRVEPRLPEHYYVEDDFEEIEVADRGTANVGFEVYFDGAVAGRVADKNGVGYNSIFLHLISAEEDEENRRQIYGHSDGENGEFSVEGIPPGEYVLFIEMQHKISNGNYYYPGTYKRENAAVIKIDLGGKAEGLNFTLPDEFRVVTLEGQVWRKDGRPATNAEVLLLCAQSSRPAGFAVEFSPTQTQTDKNGKFKLEAFTGEIYWLEARGKGTELSPSKKIVVDGNLKDIKIILSETEPLGRCQ